MSDVEPEPGLVWPTVTYPTLATISVQNQQQQQQQTVAEDGAFTAAGTMLVHLQRISDRLGSLESLQMQGLRRIEALDYRLTRVEVQVQERSEVVRGAASEASRRLQTVEAEIGRIETLLDVVRDESSAIRAGQSELKLLLQNGMGAGGAAAKGDNKWAGLKKRLTQSYFSYQSV